MEVVSMLVVAYIIMAVAYLGSGLLVYWWACWIDRQLTGGAVHDDSISMICVVLFWPMVAVANLLAMVGLLLMAIKRRR